MLSRIALLGLARISLLLTGYFALQGPAFAADVLVASPTSPIFSSELYSTSAPRNITVRNVGSAPVHIGLNSFSGPDAADFATGDDGCSNHIVNPGKNCKIQLVFNARQPIHSV